ncbi:MAG: glycosyltransferase family 2 protein [Lachnospiraceae bacterium]|nr:glycosyltransferase family 2 protein [Lachnospiraceae bacterium]
MKISYVIPCYRSEHTLEKVVEEINSVMAGMPEHTWEIVLVNDCSPDNTMEVIQRLCEKYPFIRGIDFSRNFGQHAALMAGLRHSQGDVVVCLDDDGQTPANEAGKLIEKIEEGYDAVYAEYEHKMHSAFRNLGSRANELMLRALLGKPKELYISSYFAVRRFVVEDMIRYENSYPYVIGLVLRATGKIANVKVNHREREVGSSGYTFKKLLALWINGFTAFSVMPLRIATCIGAGCAGIGFIYGIYTIIKRIVLPDIPAGYSALMSAIVFFGGMVMVLLGILGEYIGRVYISLNSAPQYVIRDRINLKTEQNNSSGETAHTGYRQTEKEQAQRKETGKE